jgi:release factor glutamine methyltransferase
MPSENRFADNAASRPAQAGGSRPASRNRTWTVREAVEWTTGYLGEKGDEHPRLSAEWLMSAATGLTRVEVYTNYDRPLTKEERAVLREGVVRRAAGEPLQYVTGEVGFRHIVVKCGKGALIPRPETEMLVEYALPAIDEAVEKRGEATVLDIGTGTGCIALSIAQERPQARVVATDISPEAAAIARRNAEALHLDDRVDVVECDLACGVNVPEDGFDLVVSNPPYIPSSEMEALPHEVAGFEPELALAGGDDGLSVFRRILAATLDESSPLLRHGGTLACELFDTTLGTAADLCREAGMVDVRVERDLTGRDRDVLARRP